jgi:hypothetical protein
MRDVGREVVDFFRQIMLFHSLHTPVQDKLQGSKGPGVPVMTFLPVSFPITTPGPWLTFHMKYEII